MNRITVRCAVFALLACAAALSIQTASADLLYNPVVTVVGDGTNIASGVGVTTAVSYYLNAVPNQAAPVSSASYDSSGGTAPTGTRLINSYTATSEGALTNNPGLANAAATGQAYTGTGYVYNVGYDKPDNTASVNSTATNAPRAVGQMTVGAGSVSNPGVLQTQTQASAYGNNNVRGATGDDSGTNLYSAGTGSPTSTAGWRDFRNNTQLASAPTNVRTVELLGGDLYGSTGSGSTGIYQINASGGTAAATAFIITGSSSGSTAHSPYEFALFNDGINPAVNGYNVAYIADDGNATGDVNGGIEKWTYNGTAWTQAYILQDTSTTYYRGLAAELDAATGKVTLFASTADGTKLQQVTDTGADSLFTTLATANTNYAFRGVALAPVPEPATWALAASALVAGVALLRRRRRR